MPLSPRKVLNRVRSLLDELPKGKWLVALPQLISRIGHANKEVHAAPALPRWEQLEEQKPYDRACTGTLF